MDHRANVITEIKNYLEKLDTIVDFDWLHKHQLLLLGK